MVVLSGGFPGATGQSIATSGVTDCGKASMLIRDVAPSQLPGFVNAILSRLACLSRTTYLKRNCFGLSAPPKWIIGAFAALSDQNVPTQPAYIGVLPSSVSDKP